MRCFRGGSPVGQSGFIALSRPVGAFVLALCAIAKSGGPPAVGRQTELVPGWSASCYCTSERDGFRCIWGQQFEPSAGKVVGGPFGTHHSRRPRLAMKELPLDPFDIWVTKRQLFFNQLERPGMFGFWTPRGTNCNRSTAAPQFY